MQTIGRIVLAILLFSASRVSAATPHDFYSGAFAHPQQGAVVLDDLGTALNAHGLNANESGFLANAIEAALAGAISEAQTVSGLLSDVAQLKQTVQTLQGTPIPGPQGIPGAQGPPGPAGASFTPLSAPSNWAKKFSAWYENAGFCLATSTPKLDLDKTIGGDFGVAVKFGGTSGDVGSFFDYKITVPKDGQYKIGVQGAVTSGNVAPTYHWEVDGVNVTGTLTWPSAGTAAMYAESAAVQLAAGPHNFRLFLDSVPAGMNGTFLFFWGRIHN